MTIAELKSSGYIIFEAISGSRAYGLATAASDTDIRGVFILPKEHFYGLNYLGQINNETNDIVYYELRKFMELLHKNNPNIIELLHMPEDCILYKHPLFDRIKISDILSKLCKNSFANYAYAQIKKARGLNKKIVNPMAKKRKTVLDFCMVHLDKEVIPFSVLLIKKGKQEAFAIAKIAHMKDCYNLFYNPLNHGGIIKEGANELHVSSIPKGEKPIGILYFNKDKYSNYCKQYKEYWSWVKNRNEARYENNIAHGKNYDTKNMMHTFRLLHMATEIAKGELIVRRPNRDYLLAIKHGEFEYEDLLHQADALKKNLDSLFEKTSLQETPDSKVINHLLFSIRNNYYNVS